MKKPVAIVGGDRKLLEKAGFDAPHGSAEFPCQNCGRPTVLTQESQRAALGEPVDLASIGPDLTTGQPFTHARCLPVLCMWCAFAEVPEVLARLEPYLNHNGKAMQPSKLHVRRAEDMFFKHPEMITDRCSRCGEEVGIFPSGHAILKQYPRIALISAIAARRPAPTRTLPPERSRKSRRF